MSYKLLLITGIIIFAVGCGSYKMLKPEPLLSPQEAGYIELKDKKNDFKIKAEKMYYISFPAPPDDKFYLVLDIPSKAKYGSFLTNQLVKEKKAGTKIGDEYNDHSAVSVYPIERGVASYFWCIDNLKEDVILSMNYRYVPQWRFKFENKYVELSEILKNSCVDRNAYETIGSGFFFKGYNYRQARDSINNDLSAIVDAHKQLLAIESIFPKTIVNSQDKAYQNYNSLKKDLEDEISFQNIFLSVINFNELLGKCKTNIAHTVETIDDFIKYFHNKSKLATNVLDESKKLMAHQLDEVVVLYDQKLTSKIDAKPFDRELYLLKKFGQIATLYETADISVPKFFTALNMYINDFDTKSLSLLAAADSIEVVKTIVKNLSILPKNDFFGGIVSRTAMAQSFIPSKIGEEHGKYAAFQCSQKLNTEVDLVSSVINKGMTEYQEADALIPQVNVQINAKDYSAALGILKKNMHLDFLIEKYKPMDRLSIDEQSKDIGDALSGHKYNVAEAGLQQLYRDNNFLDMSEILPYRNGIVRRLEDSLYFQVDRYTRWKINKFLEEHVFTLNDVDSLYVDSVFLPAHDITFSTGGNSELIERKNDLVTHLAKTKEYSFPQKAIKILFDDFLKHPADSGVWRARAIVTHGEHYKGDDKKTMRMIAECHPWRAKWIVKPKQYRRVFALPLTNKPDGNNRYFVRLNIRIPTEAKFPVYDVNIKLPKWLAKNAATKQWYEKILMNKSPLKNEGRFTISAPTASNNYECQITPVRMKSEGKNNYLDIYFYHRSFSPIPISVMAQKPIIKKN